MTPHLSRPSRRARRTVNVHPSDEVALVAEIRAARARARRMDLPSWLVAFNEALGPAMELELDAAEQAALLAEMAEQGSEIQRAVATGAERRELPGYVAHGIVATMRLRRRPVPLELASIPTSEREDVAHALAEITRLGELRETFLCWGADVGEIDAALAEHTRTVAAFRARCAELGIDAETAIAALGRAR